MEDLRKRIVQLLRENAPLSLKQEIDEMEVLIEQKNTDWHSLKCMK